MPAIHDANKEICTIRLPRRLMDQVRTIAAAEQESQAMVIRRLLRDSLDRRDAPHGEAA
jgi:predicted transcriptional regulator